MNIDEMIDKYDGFTVTDDELDEIWENELVEKVDNCGCSGAHYGLHWWAVEFINGSTIDIYTKE